MLHDIFIEVKTFLPKRSLLRTCSSLSTTGVHSSAASHFNFVKFPLDRSVLRLPETPTRLSFVGGGKVSYGCVFLKMGANIDSVSMLLDIRHPFEVIALVTSPRDGGVKWGQGVRKNKNLSSKRVSQFELSLGTLPYRPITYLRTHAVASCDN